MKSIDRILKTFDSRGPVHAELVKKYRDRFIKDPELSQKYIHVGKVSDVAAEAFKMGLDWERRDLDKIVKKLLHITTVLIEANTLQEFNKAKKIALKRLAESEKLAIRIRPILEISE